MGGRSKHRDRESLRRGQVRPPARVRSRVGAAQRRDHCRPTHGCGTGCQERDRTIPIVMLNTGDPVGLGLVASLGRPAGNVTGTAYTVGSETFGKGLELLKEAVPKLGRVAVLSNPANPGQPLAIDNLRKAAAP